MNDYLIYYQLRDLGGFNPHEYKAECVSPTPDSAIEMLKKINVGTINITKVYLKIKEF